MKVPLTIIDHLERAEVVYGPRTIVVDEPDQPAAPWPALTATRLAETARAQAAALDRLGIGVGERVAVVSQNSARLLAAFWGVSASGRVLVPVNFRLNSAEVEYIVEHSGASMVLIDPELDESLAKVTAEHRYVIGAESDDVLYAFDTEPVPWEPDEDATATINYTSGTTARPKGVQLTHRNLWVNATTFALHARVIDQNGDGLVPTPQNVKYVVEGCPPSRRHDANALRQRRKGFFAHGVEESFCGQPGL